MENHAFTSPEIAKEMERVYGSNAKIVQIEVQHDDEVKKYMTMMQEARERAAKLRVKGKCSPRSRNLYCRLIRCIRKVEKKGTAKNPVAVCRAKIK